MIFIGFLLILLVDIKSTEQENLNSYNVETFIDKITQYNERADAIRDSCIMSNNHNQYLYIPYPMNRNFNDKIIFDMYNLVLKEYAKVIEVTPLSVLTIENSNKNTLVDKRMWSEIFQCYGNMFLNSVEKQRIRQLKNQFFNLKYSHKNIANKDDLLLIMQPGIYSMVIFENCIEIEEDITLLYKILENIEDELECYFTKLQIVFALKFVSTEEVDAWNKIDIKTKLARNNNQYKLLTISVNNLIKDTLLLKTKCIIKFTDIILPLIYNLEIKKQNKNVSFAKVYKKKLATCNFNLFSTKKANYNFKQILQFQVIGSNETFYYIKVSNYLRNYYIIFVMTNKKIKNLLYHFEKCISIYYIEELQKKLICRYSYIEIIDYCEKNNRNQNESRVTMLINGCQRFDNFKENFFLYLETPFGKYSDLLPFGIALSSSRFLNWYVDDSFFVNYNHTSSIISYKYIRKLTDFLICEDKGSIEKTYLRAHLKAFVHQLDCNYNHNIFNILIIKDIIMPNLLTKKSFENFEILIIAIRKNDNNYFKEYLIFPIKVYNEIFFISLLNNSWILFLSEIINIEKKNSLKSITLLNKCVCAEIIFTQNREFFDRTNMSRLISHILSIKRIELYILLHDSKDLLIDKHKELIKKCLRGHNLHKYEKFIFEQSPYGLFINYYRKVKDFKMKVKFYNLLTVSYCKILVEQYDLLNLNQNNMIWYYHSLNSIDFNINMPSRYNKFNVFF